MVDWWPGPNDNGHFTRLLAAAAPAPVAGRLRATRVASVPSSGVIRVAIEQPFAVANLRLVGAGVHRVHRVHLVLGEYHRATLWRAPGGWRPREQLQALQAARALKGVAGLPAAVVAHAASFLTAHSGDVDAQVSAARVALHAACAPPPGCFVVSHAGEVPHAQLPFPYTSQGACLPAALFHAVKVQVDWAQGAEEALALEYDEVETQLPPVDDQGFHLWRTASSLQEEHADAGELASGRLRVWLSGHDVRALHVVGPAAGCWTGGRVRVNGVLLAGPVLVRVGDARWRVDFAPPISLSRIDRLDLEVDFADGDDNERNNRNNSGNSGTALLVTAAATNFIATYHMDMYRVIYLF